MIRPGSVTARGRSPVTSDCSCGANTSASMPGDDVNDLIDPASGLAVLQQTR